MARTKKAWDGRSKVVLALFIEGWSELVSARVRLQRCRTPISVRTVQIPTFVSMPQSHSWTLLSWLASSRPPALITDAAATSQAATG